jgi:hypothetical protein
MIRKVTARRAKARDEARLDYIRSNDMDPAH